MATVSVSNTVGADVGANTVEFFRLLTRDPARVSQLFGRGHIRCLATTTDASVGTFVTLTSITLNAADGPLTFDAGTARVIKFKAIGKPTGATTTTEYFEGAILVIGGATPTVIVPGGTGKAFDVDNGTVGGLITGLAGVGTLALQLAGKAATALNWVIDVQVDDPIAVT